MSNQFPATNTSEENARVFFELAERFCAKGAEVGYKIRPALSPDLPHLKSTSLEFQKQALNLLRVVVEIHEEKSPDQKLGLLSKQLLWRALRKLNLTPSSEAFTQIQDDDVVMIYDENFHVLFWSIQFFKFSSFTIEDLLFTPWPAKTRRDPKFHDMCVKVSQEVYSGKITGDYYPEIPEHLVEEIDSSESLKTLMSVPFVTPLKKNGQFGGMLVVQRMRFAP